MSGKRQATSELNHDNWDCEEEEEPRGTFRTASHDELKNRVIKKARRKVVAGTDAADAGSGASKSIFSGFAGFGKAASTPGPSAAASPFSFLAKIPAVAASASATPSFSFGGGSAATSSTKPKEAEAADEGKKPNTAATKESSSNEKSANYYAQLKGLNQAVSDWIKTHVDKNPMCLLTPIFKDYETHLSVIERDEAQQKGNSVSDSDKKLATSTDPASVGISNFKFSSSVASSTPVPVVAAAVSASPAASFSFGAGSALSSISGATAPTSTKSIFGGAATTTAAAAEPSKTNGFSFGLKTDAKKSTSTTSAATSGFTFGKTDEKPVATKGFSFAADTAAVPFSFGNIQPPAAIAPSASTSGANEDDEDQPPKVEFTKVVEEDSVYSKKVKVFVKKDGNFADRGVGTLYLKPVKDSDKTQLLVRADTNLGNILVNLILSTGLPAQRMGKNNIMLVCIPTPDADKPTSMLLRVKTGEEADELLDTIEKYKK